jgi:C4-dicarboxylate-specific signal transduction histidine kinase
MLDGISGGWEDVGALRSATFFELRPGDYTFRVRAANGDGTWNEEGAELAFSVQPFYWQSLWFQTAATALIIAALGGTAWWQLHTRHLRRVARLQREQRQQAELAHVSRLSLLGELSASMAHELNQPLTAILANSQAAQRFMANGEPDLGEFREILKDIASDTTRARDVIRNLRTLVKKGDFSPVALDLNDIISEVIGFLHGDIVNRNVTVSLELASDLPPVLGDRVQLQQVLLNLLINAFDAVGDKPADERLVTIRTALDDETAVRVSVRDRGIGMAPERLAQLFQAFCTTKKNGLGMGLSVTRSIVEAHRGRIWAEPNPDAGMAFHFTVPLAKSAS